MGCIYLVTNRINGKQYVGKTSKTMKVRQAVHFAHAKMEGETNIYFHRAIRKYGSDAFDWEVLEENDRSDMLDRLERYYIKKLQTRVPHGYNLTDGGDGHPGYVRSPEWRAKVSQAKMGHFVSEESRRRMSEGQKRAMTPARLAKMSSDRMGVKRGPMSEEQKKKIGKANKGRRFGPLSEEHRAKVSEGVQRSMTPEVRQKIREGVQRSMTPEVRQKIRERIKRYWKMKRETSKDK